MPPPKGAQRLQGGAHHEGPWLLWPLPSPSRRGPQRKAARARANLGRGELQDTVPISSAALSEVLAKLESEGLVTRTRSQSDKRQLDVSLTEDGQAEAKLCAEKRTKFEEVAFSVLSEEERTQLLEVLDRLMGHWQKIEEEDRTVDK